MTAAPRLSVVIPAFNEVEMLSHGPGMLPQLLQARRRVGR